MILEDSVYAGMYLYSHKHTEHSIYLVWLQTLC